jgi:hypothetical protein
VKAALQDNVAPPVSPYFFSLLFLRFLKFSIFKEVGNFSWSAARILAKRTSSDSSKSAPNYHDEIRSALRLARSLIESGYLSSSPFSTDRNPGGLVFLNYRSALAVHEVMPLGVSHIQARAIDIQSYGYIFMIMSPTS